MKERYTFETRPQHSHRRTKDEKDDAVFVSLNNRPAMSQWLIDKARETGNTRAEVVRQCVEFVMLDGRPHA